MNLIKKIGIYSVLSPIGYACFGINSYRALESVIDGQGNNEQMLTHAIGMLLGIIISTKHISTYNRLVKDFKKDGYNPMLAKTQMYSWCNRHVLKLAALTTGNLNEFLEQCKKEGHREYHFLPKIHRFNEVNH